MAKIMVVGLGSGDVSQLTLGAWRRLQQADIIRLRTEDHPVVGMLQENGISYETFDSIYEASKTFEEAYEHMTEELIRLAQQSDQEVVYAVPGHPCVAEATVRMLKKRCAQLAISLEIIGGESFLDQAFIRLGFDPIEGFMLLDASQIQSAHLQPHMHTIITQLYDSFTASDAKLALLDVYPPDYEIVFARALGIEGEESIQRIPLFELDRLSDYGNHCIVWIPKSDDEQLRIRRFERLHDIVSILRSPEGCPWDREQTHASIRKNLIEETYEVLETIDDENPEAMCEELGDLLLQVMLHAQMEEEEGIFDIYDIIQGLNEKLIRRHPHVFGDAAANDADAALNNWDAVKRAEKKARGEDVEQASLLDGVPRALPGTLKALEYQKRAAKVGFDWTELADVFAKITEELAELRDVSNDVDLREQQKEELGDLLFAVINAARFLKIDPEEALASVNRKFYQRFSHIEAQLQKNQRTFSETSIEEMETWWQEAKRLKNN